MSNVKARVPGFLARTWRWLKGQLVGDVPSKDALCEYDCRKEQCTEGEWENCERRLSGAAGQLMPDKPDRSTPPGKT